MQGAFWATSTQSLLTTLNWFLKKMYIYQKCFQTKKKKVDTILGLHFEAVAMNAVAQSDKYQALKLSNIVLYYEMYMAH